jgi:ribosome-associated toxin RatA of RatAB toxin-antitoxin module
MSHAREFESTCKTSTRIERTPEVVYQALFNLKGWPELLPHVKAIDVLYDDGRYQEFLMTVTSETDAGTLTVRSVRLCDEVSWRIEFFQPKPPAFLIHHAGGWQFDPVDDGKACEVTTYHQWNLNHPSAQHIFSAAGDAYAQRAHQLLLGHAEFALENWKRILETELISVGGRR